MEQIINIYNYTCVQSFLRDYFDEKKKTSPTFSLANWARRLNIENKSVIGMIITHRRLPDDKLFEKLSDFFNFDVDQKEFFRLILTYNKASNEIIKKDQLEKIKAFRYKKDRKVLDEQTFERISSWYGMAIREMVHLKDFQLNAEWIAKKLKIDVPVEKIEETLKTLIEVGLVSDGSSASKSPVSIETTDNISSAAIRNYHRQNFQNLLWAIENMELTDRYYRSSAFTMNREDLPELRKMILDFQNQVTSRFMKEDGDVTMGVSSQFITYTE